jgi:hypothetical protein
MLAPLFGSVITFSMIATFVYSAFLSLDLVDVISFDKKKQADVGGPCSVSFGLTTTSSGRDEFYSVLDSPVHHESHGEDWLCVSRMYP